MCENSLRLRPIYFALTHNNNTIMGVNVLRFAFVIFIAILFLRLLNDGLEFHKIFTYLICSVFRYDMGY